jgi:hypothetical protein
MVHHSSAEAQREMTPEWERAWPIGGTCGGAAVWTSDALRLTAGMERGKRKVHALGAALRPLHALTKRQGRNKGGGSHERKKNQSNEQIVHEEAPSNPMVHEMRNTGKSLQPMRE